MATTLGAFEYSITVDGVESDWKLVEAVLDEAIGELPMAVFDVVSSTPFGIGLETVISFELARANQGQTVGDPRVWTGVVVRIEDIGRTISRRYRARIHVSHKGYRMTLARRCRVLKKQKAADVARKVMGESGLQVDGVPDSQFLYDFVTQYFETDLAWLQRLADADGFVFRWPTDSAELVEFYRPDTRDGESELTLPLVAPDDAPTVDEECVRAFVHEQRVAPTALHAYGWDAGKKQEVVAQATVPDARALNNAEDMGGTLAGWPYGLNREGGTRALVTTDVAVTALHRGESNAIGLSAGRSFELVDNTGGERGGKYSVLRVQHRLSLATDAEGGTTAIYENSFECVREGFPARPPAQPRPRALAPVVAIVVGINDAGDDSHRACEVAVKFPQWGPASADSVWLRLAQPFAGKDHGFLFLPHINDEVLVHFVDGDPDKPVVLGALYNGQDETPVALPNNYTRNVIRASPYEGNGDPDEVFFEENTDRRILGINAANDHEVTVKRDVSVTVDRDRTTTVKRDEKLTVQGAMTTEVTKDRTNTVKANAKETVDQNSEVTVKGNAKETIFGSLKVSADAGITLQCGDTKIEITPAGITLSNAAGAKVQLIGPMVNLN